MSAVETIRQSQMKGEGSKQKNKKMLVGIFILIGIIVVLIGVLVYLLADRGEEKRNVVVTQDNVEEILAGEPPVASGHYNVVMNTTWYFPSGSSPSNNAYVENDAANTNDIYFDIVLADTEEPIYASPVLPLGSHIENIALDKSLDAGTYDCVCIYHLIDEEQNTLSTVRVSVTVVVEN